MVVPTLVYGNAVGFVQIHVITIVQVHVKEIVIRHARVLATKLVLTIVQGTVSLHAKQLAMEQPPINFI